MNFRKFYQEQELKAEDLNEAFVQVAEGMDGRYQDFFTEGVIHGWTLPTAHTGWTINFTDGQLLQSGHRIDTGGASVSIATDHAGASALPSSGKYRWVTVSVLYGQSLSDSATDGLGNVVYKTWTDDFNKLGTSLLADATAVANNAGVGLLYVTAGTEANIGTGLTLPSAPGTILCDILVTFGETEVNYNAGRVYYGRRPVAHLKTTSPMGFPGDPAVSRFDYSLLWEIEGRSFKTRFYQGFFGLVVTSNAAWSADMAIPFGPASIWTADTPGNPATKITFWDGMIIQKKFAADSGTPWSDASLSTSGWDSYMTIDANAFQSMYSAIDGNGNIEGHGVITGYFSWYGAVASSAYYGGAVQFPRQFTGTPSSVTLGAAGPGETNVAGLSVVNLSRYGCDVKGLASTFSVLVYQRVYTATL